MDMPANIDDAFAKFQEMAGRLDEELKATDFKGKKIREYKPATPFAEGLGLTKAVSGAVKGALMELDQPEFE